ncbi:CD2 antigen cytoplasmic tail-binding protein 2 [Marchantia polymorpha subsp. ruderalis]|uniref:OCRE domain-containing protein n=2 Tax=Marchantia polymorpha TaxID=3197 RepID=A0AAF6BAY2_MARPO|nr:hypothetical protein MARPO_0041s0053 [Marchantia polymorpha]PTQ40154.1 hypothetical protein MARPO_0041s0053 [Marchantia polymorpha]BBN09165.1 hypothetical protein Mp_4g17710 [Marchantia polymorpha subsp. ruderalis]BBN09166.1 hypothetical protein Mp_4g17710 [Marchantia polymorpha subsp. ruderalis]|eukprot:PTQ40153.1 hypothetical protein MARPO_0041s0053 [Marchantia polymorpha]
MEMPTAPALSVRKRFHFSYEDDPAKDEAPRAKKARFPKGRKGAAGEVPARTLGVIDGEEDEGPIILSADPRVAAKERALKRDPTTEQIRVEDTGVLADVTVAEEIYEEEDEEIVEDGQRFEPFNLKQEREEGYFDGQGNYVEYRNENDGKDAWLDSVEVDTRFANKALAQTGKDAEVDGDNLGKDELWAIKRRIADALQPGETVLRALRRLKGTPKDGNKRERMSEANKAIFDQLTEDAVKLLEDGDYNVYEEKRETFQREAEGYAALARLRAGITSVESSQAGSAGDMFGDDDEVLEQAGAPSQSKGLPTAGTVEVNGKGHDMFGDDDEEERSENGNAAQQGVTHGSEGSAPVDGSGYVYDEASGYYYNSDVGYYYDANSGLYCSASTGLWYRFDEETNSYVEVAQ